MTEDRYAVACNYVEATNVARTGALAYVIWRTGGNIERVHLLVRSRGGRWVDKWEALNRVGNVRVKTIPPGHPLYDDERIARGRDVAEQLLADDVLMGRHPVETFDGRVIVHGRHATLDEAAGRLGGTWTGRAGVYEFPAGAEVELRDVAARIGADRGSVAVGRAP